MPKSAVSFKVILGKELEYKHEGIQKELDLNLSKDQLTRLKEMDERRQLEMIRQNRKKFENDSLNKLRWPSEGIFLTEDRDMMALSFTPDVVIQ